VRLLLVKRRRGSEFDGAKLGFRFAFGFPFQNQFRFDMLPDIQLHPLVHVSISQVLVKLEGICAHRPGRHLAARPLMLKKKPVYTILRLEAET
jgi:hypothetical protein